jgi:CRISPR-associated endonuclease/helicase Cas3
MGIEYFAHSPADKPKSQPPDGWHPLAQHLSVVASLAEDFARIARPILPSDDDERRREKDSFHRGAFWAGLLHDLGKYRPEFQEMIRGKHPRNEQTRHKQAGAAVAADGHRADIAFVIAGHHGGIPDLVDLQQLIKAPGGRDVAQKVWETGKAECPELDQPIAAWQAGKDPLLFDFLVRLQFSCLVDADWKDTSDFDRLSKGLLPEPAPPPLDASTRLENVLAYIRERAQACQDVQIAALRQQVLGAALGAAEQPPGLFALTVPTGGGKTLSGLAFALAHAQRHGLRRVIYVAPYLTIIEQNAREIRRALQVESDSEVVFEHHSLAEPAGGAADEAQSEEVARRAENWDAPIIVTTSVQFYESLFSNRPGPCRKLHNIACSVVILDESQTLPPDLLGPTCSMLSQLTRVAGCSVLLCTATQPAWNEREDLPEGLAGVREIVPAHLRLFERLLRVRVHWPGASEAPLDWPAVAARMAEQPAALCIVNTRRAAREIFHQLVQLGCQDALHLSTTMCPAHRLEVLDSVRQRLHAGKPCRLVSTQLIEAGVDVDFPLVMRELAPLEAIIQSAGRCNREGLLNTPDGAPGGRVIVFRSCEGKVPPDRWYRSGIDTLEQAFLGLGREPDISRPDGMQEYFRRLYHTGELDRHHIQDDRRNRRFATAADKYRVIDEFTIPVIIASWDQRSTEVEQLLHQLRREPSKRLDRSLGPFQVNLRPYELLQVAGQAVDDPCGVKVWLGPYDPRMGIRIEGDPPGLIV